MSCVDDPSMIGQLMFIKMSLWKIWVEFTGVGCVFQINDTHLKHHFYLGYDKNIKKARIVDF